MRRLRRLVDDLGLYLGQHRGAMLLLLAALVAGVVFGSLAAGAMSLQERQDLTALLRGFMHGLDVETRLPPGQALHTALSGHGRTLLLFWLLAVSVIGAVGVVFVSFMRGFVNGFVVALLVEELGTRGVVFAAAAVLPHNLLVVPALVVAGAAVLTFARKTAVGCLGRRRLHFQRDLLLCTGLLLLTAPCLALAALVEAYVTPILMRLAVGLV